MIRSRKVEYRGLVFDSREECDRWVELVCMEIRGEIWGLRRQVRFEVLGRQVRGELVHRKRGDRFIERVVERNVEYTCDFVYGEGSRIVVEDVKSEWTRKERDWSLRRKLMVRKILEHNGRVHRREWVLREYVVGARKRVRVIDH